MMYTVDMNAPELVFPSSSSDQAFALDAKSVHIDNKLEWTNGKSHLDVGAILLDSTTVLLNGCSACVGKEYKRTTSMMPKDGIPVAILHVSFPNGIQVDARSL